MERNELLNLLYAERQRLSDQNNQNGWSIWILIGGIITLSWMLLEHYESVMQSDLLDFCWLQVIILFRDFITIAFALLLIKNYISDKKEKYHPDRFNKSKVPLFIILDMIIAISLIILYKFFNNDSIYVITICAIYVYLGVKIAQVCLYIKIRQELSLLFAKFVYMSASLIILTIGIYKIHTYSSYYIANTKYALLLCGIIVLLYILFWHILNPTKKKIIAIDELIDRFIVSDEDDTKSIYNEFIIIKIGSKYSQLHENKFHKIKTLLRKQEYYIESIEECIKKLESRKYADNITLQKSIKSFKNFQAESIKINKLQNKISLKTEKDMKYMVLNKENKIELKKLIEILEIDLSISGKNINTIAELLLKFNKIIQTQKQIYIKSTK